MGLCPIKIFGSLYCTLLAVVGYASILKRARGPYDFIEQFFLLLVWGTVLLMLPCLGNFVIIKTLVFCGVLTFYVLTVTKLPW